MFFRQIAGQVIGGVGVGLSLSLLAAGEARAVSFTFTKIADTNTAIPGGTGNFSDFAGEVPEIDGNDVTFLGRNSNLGGGIYIDRNGSLAKVVDTNTTIPNSADKFSSFFGYAIDDGKVVFRGSGSAFFDGIYIADNGSLTKVVDTNTTIPDGVGNFTFLGAPVFDADNVAFEASGDNQQRGIYTIIGSSLTKVADTNTAVPDGTGNFFFSFASPAIDGDKVAFRGFYNLEGLIYGGIYIADSGSLSKVVDANTTILDGTVNFISFGGPAIDGGNIAFVASDSSFQEGIYTVIGGSLTKVAGTNTAIPDGTGNFTSFFQPAINDDNIVFTGGRPGFGLGIYTTIGGSLTKVLSPNDILDGKTVRFAELGRNGLSENSLAFLAYFSDGSEGIYRADLVVDEPPTSVPEPASTLGLLTLGAISAGSLLNRRKT